MLVTVDLLAQPLFKTSIHCVFWSMHTCYAYSPCGHRFWIACGPLCRRQHKRVKYESGLTHKNARQ